jgi:hypothetical protein
LLLAVVICALLRKRIARSSWWRWIAAFVFSCAIAPTIVPGACGLAIQPPWYWFADFTGPDLPGYVVMGLFFTALPILLTMLLLGIAFEIFCRRSQRRSAMMNVSKA